MIQDATMELFSLRETYTLRPDLLKSFTNVLKSSANAKNSSIASD